jgi:hypothetical protein
MVLLNGVWVQIRKLFWLPWPASNLFLFLFLHKPPLDTDDCITDTRWAMGSIKMPYNIGRLGSFDNKQEGRRCNAHHARHFV